MGTAFLPTELWIADMLNAIFLVIGTIFLLKFLQGGAVKKWSNLAGIGIILFALLHEGGEVLCGSGIHGGFPQTAWGRLHILILGIIGGLIYLIATYMMYRKFKELTGDLKKK